MTSINLKFRRTNRGNLYATKCGLGISVFKDKLGMYAWKIRDRLGNDRFAQEQFDSEHAALDDLEMALVEVLIATGAIDLDDEDEVDDYA